MNSLYAQKKHLFIICDPFSADLQIPWVGAGIGIIIGVILVIADYTIPEKPSLKVSVHHTIIMTFS